ncbi:hypothetical protein BA92_10550 [Sanguibacteroides justesenii]|uniref:Uncharacterized protein n=1 Tax=Sanguibacteroides justesenii TaxID=1547597 RepID=A0A0C3RGI2_9PORP|nr:hypothetical protein BA92_10550 [Sanguibacteroides justesenii]
MEAAEIVCFGILFLIEKTKRLKLKIESMVVFGFFIVVAVSGLLLPHFLTEPDHKLESNK